LGSVGEREIDGRRALACEWLEAGALGGFASGTVLGIRTRRYHALLLAAMRPPAERWGLVPDVEAWIEANDQRSPLSTSIYDGDVMHPNGATYLRSFAIDPWPSWTWSLPDGNEIVGELFVPPGLSVVMLRWTRTRGDGAARLLVRPRLGPRDLHSTHHGN